MLCLMQYAKNFVEIWFSWLSQVNRRVFPFAFSHVDGSNTLTNYSYARSLLLHPFELTVKCQFNCNMDFGIQESDTFPSTETHLITLRHFCRLGCACHLVFKFLFTTAFVALMYPIENPVSSMLYIFSIVI